MLCKEMSNHLISIILPIYNIEQYLPSCMESLFAQTYTHLEFIMVDDGSDSICAALCDKYAAMDSRVRVFHKSNGGLSDARNYGIERAKGDYITCIDPDDFVDTDYIDYLYNLIVKYDTRMAIAQHRVLYDNGTKRDYGTLGCDVLDNKTCLERMLYHDVIDTSAWGKLYHKSLFDNVKYPVGRIFEDIGTTYKLFLQCNRIAVGYESKYNYVFHNNSIVNGNFKPNKFDLIYMTDMMADEVTSIYPDLRQAALRRQVYARLSTLNQMLRTDMYNTEKKQILKYIKQNRHMILHDNKAPKRDKIAIVLLSISFRLYKVCWLKYQAWIFS